MGRAKKKGASSTGEFSLFDDADASDADSEEDLPRDEAGRAKIKLQYIELLNIRVRKLAGKILNRERINKTLEGVYFVCCRCEKVCHNLDEGLIEDEENKKNVCVPCSKQPADVDSESTKKSSATSKSASGSPAKKKVVAKKAKAPAKKKVAAKPAAKNKK